MSDNSEERFYESLEVEYLQALCEGGETFFGAVLGITQQRIETGLDSLSPRQRMLYDRHVQPRLDAAEGCAECGHLMTVDEMSICKDCFDCKCAKDD